MTSYTRSDLCLGHGGGRECTYAPEVDGCLQHGDMDHGVISYCDGTCQSALDEYREYLHGNGRHLVPLSTQDSITLDVSRCTHDAPVSYLVTFQGPDAERWALAYMAARPTYHFDQVIEAPFCSVAYPTLYATLYPTCDHGMDASLCMDPYGPNHFGTLDQELAHGW